MYRADSVSHLEQTNRVSITITAVALSTLVMLGACTAGGEKQTADAGAPATVSAPAVPAGNPETSAGEIDSPDAKSPVVTFASAHAAYTHREYAEAQESFGAYVERHPDDAFGYYMLGLSAWKNRDLDAAKAALKQ
jgi:TolA-binding protein